MDKKTIKMLLKKIEDRSEISDKGECVIWNGTCTQYACILYYNSNGQQNKIHVVGFLWMHNYPNIPIKSTEKFVHSCNNPKCIAIEHISIKPKAEPISKQKVWERMLKYSKRN